VSDKDKAMVDGLVEDADRDRALAAEWSGPLAALDVDALRRALYTVSQRHDWEHVEDREDRTQEIADEYAREVVTGSKTA